MYLRTYYRRGSRKDSERGPLTFAWKMKTCGVFVCGGGEGVESRKSSIVISGDHFSEVTFEGGIG